MKNANITHLSMRVVAGILIILLIFTSAHTENFIMAQSPNEGEYTVIDIDSVPDITVAFGTAKDEIDLPEYIQVMISYTPAATTSSAIVASSQLSNIISQSSSTSTSTSTAITAASSNLVNSATTSPTVDNKLTKSIIIPVVWSCNNYNPLIPGEYVFTAAFANNTYENHVLTLAEDVVMPSLTVTVREDTNFKNIVIREESENGPVIASLTDKGEAIPVLAPGREYYLCVNVNSPAGDDGYVKITLGNLDGPNAGANGLVYTNIPGNIFKTSNIVHDSFDKLKCYTDIENPVYGCNNTAFSLPDGELLYHIKQTKMRNQAIYCAIGFKLDMTYWNNETILSDAIHFEIGTNDNGIETCTYKIQTDVQADTSKAKKFYIGTSVSKLNCAMDTVSNSIYNTLASSNFSSIICKEIGYDINYPAGAILEGISFSSTDTKLLTNASSGIINIGDEIENGDGTITRHIVLRNCYKKEGSMYIGFISLKFPSTIFKADSIQKLVLSNGYYISFENEEKKNDLLFSTTDTKVISFILSDSAKDYTKITPINRLTSTKTGMGSVYNWNVDRPDGDIIETTSLINGAYILNDNTVMTEEEKTIKCNYNTTDEQVAINFITLPVGVDENNKLLQSITVSWTGTDSSGDMKHGETVCDKVRITADCGFVILKAEDLGIKSFKSVQADIGRLPAQYRSSSSSRANSTDFGSNNCAAYGYFTDQTVGNRIKSTFELCNTSEDAAINDISCESIADSTDDARTFFYNKITTQINSAKVVAGNSVTLKSQILGVNSLVMAGTDTYPGDSTSLVVNPVVILKLPKGMSYSNLSFRKYINQYYGCSGTSKNTITQPLDYTVDNISYMNNTNDGVSLYKITFNDKDLVMGYFDKDGQYVCLQMTITFNTEKTITTQTYDFNDLVNVTSESNIAASQYSSKGYSQIVEDIYGINKGNPLGGGRIDNSSVIGLSIQRLSAITVKNEIATTKLDGCYIADEDRVWNTYDPSNPNSVTFLGLKSEGQYRVQINNPSTSDAHEFKMIVPIPKANQNMGTKFCEQDNQFDMVFIPVNVPTGYEIDYIRVNSISEGTIFSNIEYTEATLETANAILVKKDKIASNAEDTLLFDFSIDNTADNSILSGQINIWRNCISYKMDEQLQESTGRFVAAEIAGEGISGTVFQDDNGNGIMDGAEAGVQGITINAKDDNGRIQTAVTDINGTYSFTQIRENSIVLTMTVPDNASYRFGKEPMTNIPDGIIGNMVSPSSDGKSAALVLNHIVGNETINAAVSHMFSVTYDNGTGEGLVPSKKDYNSGEMVRVEAAPSGMYRTGNYFYGWSDGKMPATIYYPGDTFNITEDVTLTAIWKVKTLVLIFDYQGGTTNSAGYDKKKVVYYQQYGKADAENKTWPENPTKGTVEEGWRFWKWELPSGKTLGYGTAIIKTSRVTIVDDTTIHAVYSRLSEKNGQMNVLYGQESTESNPFYDFTGINIINDAEPTDSNSITYKLTSGNLPEGMSFSSDYTKIYGKANAVTDGPVKLTIDIKARNGLVFTYTLQINVKPLDLSISMDTNPQAGVVMNSITKTAAVELTAKVHGIINNEIANSENNITFYITKNGGAKEELGSAKLDNSGTANYIWLIDENADSSIAGTYTISAEIKNLFDKYNIKTNKPLTGFVVAQAPIVKHTIIFDTNNSGVEAPGNQIAIQAKTYGVLPAVARAGYHFDGWYTKTAGGYEIKASDIVNLGEIANTQTLYTHWTIKEYRVIYDTNGCEAVLESKIVHYSDHALLPDIEPARKGYNLTGWIEKNTKHEVTNETLYSSIVDDDKTGSVTLIAQWSAKSYLVTYNANEGSVSASTFRITYDSEYGALVVPSRNGYKFDGWMDKNNKIVKPDTKYMIDSPSTLMAQWSEKTNYKVVYNTNGGNELTDRTRVSWTSKRLASPVNPERKGYNFTGWKYDNKNITDNTTYASLAVTDNILSVTLTAQWEPKKYLLTYNANVPSASGNLTGLNDSTKEITFGDFYGNLLSPSFTGYDFLGWYTKKDGGDRVTSTTIVDAFENHSLYAHWSIKTYAVTLPASQTGYSIIPEPGINNPVDHAHDYSFRISFADGYGKSKLFAVKVKKSDEENDKAVKLTEATGGTNSLTGIYTITNITESMTVIIEGVQDIAAPYGEIIVGTNNSNRWNSFFNVMTFGVFFKETQNVSIAYNDKGSGINKVQYYVAYSAIKEEFALSSTSIDWQPYNNTFSIDPNRECIIYAKLTDNAGNTVIINTDGLVLDNIEPEITGIVNNGVYIGDTVVTVTDLYDVSVTVNGQPQSIDEYNQFILQPSDDEYVIVATDKAGNESIYNVIINQAVCNIQTTVPVFNDEVYGYEDLAAQPIVIKTMGNVDAMISSVTLVGDNASDFEINDTSGTMIIANTSDTSYTVKPVGGLSAGKHIAKIVVSYGNGLTDETEISFNVEPREAVIEWGNTIFTFNNSKPVVTAYVTNLVAGDECLVTVAVADDFVPGIYEDKAVAEALSNKNYKLPADNKTSYVINKADITGVSFIPYVGMYDGCYHDAITEINGVIDGDIIEYYIADDELNWVKWEGTNVTPQVGGAKHTKIKVVIKREYYNDYEQIVTAVVHKPPTVEISIPVYDEQNISNMTVKGVAILGDFEVVTQIFQYHKANDNNWININTIGDSVELNALDENTVYELRLIVSDIKGNIAYSVQRFRTNANIQNEAVVEGKISGHADRLYSVTLEMGNTIVASKTGLSQRDSFTFSNVHDGEYNLVVTDGLNEVTRLVSVKDGHTDNLGIIEISTKQTSIEIGADAPDAAVDGLNELYQTNIFSTDSEANTAIDDGGNVNIKLVVNSSTDTNVMEDIKEKADKNSKQIDFFTDLRVIMVVTSMDGISSETSLSSTEELILIAIPISTDAQGKEDYQMFRNHNGRIDELSLLTGDSITSPADEGFYVDGAYAYVWAREFSTYSLLYKKDASVPKIPIVNAGSSSNTPTTPITPTDSSDPLPERLERIDDESELAKDKPTGELEKIELAQNSAKKTPDSIDMVQNEPVNIPEQAAQLQDVNAPEKSELTQEELIKVTERLVIAPKKVEIGRVYQDDGGKQIRPVIITGNSGASIAATSGRSIKNDSLNTDNPWSWLIIIAITVYLILILFANERIWRYRNVLLAADILFTLIFAIHGHNNLDWSLFIGNIILAISGYFAKACLIKYSK